MSRPPDHDRTDRDDERDTTQRTELSAGPRRSGLHSACVVVIHGEGLGKRIDVDEKPIIVGRSQECDLHIPHPSVSRQHCSIWRDAEGYRVRDLGSTNRTRVNEQRIDGAMLADGDHITIGETILKFISHASVEARYHEEVYQLATHDALTELCNRRHFLELLDKEIARAERHARPLALAIVDVDHFKRVNDEHGHIAGDGVLKRIAEVLRAHVRGEDIAARIGGEEFAVLLPEESPAAARAFAEQLREAIAAETFAPGGVPRRMTVSIGLADLSATRATRSALMRAADEALYAAKEGGRNLVCCVE
jgi:diguanylate cyclase (GGDEF)-like protein